VRKLSIVALCTLVFLNAPSNVASKDLSRLSEKELADLIEYHDDLYWDRGRPEISDAEYDRITLALKAINPQHPLLTKVNGWSGTENGVYHAEPMLSLQKVYSLDEVVKWAKLGSRSGKERFFIQPKYDGLAADYRDGVLSTRGNGRMGRDISAVLPYVQLKSAGYTGCVDRNMRGELILLPADYDQVCGNMSSLKLKLYSNPRSAVAGITGAKSLDEVLMNKVKLTFIDFKLHEYEVAFEELEQKWPDIKRQISSLPYPMDGIVIKYADAEFAGKLGATSHHPRSAVAFKFPNKTAEVVLASVEWQCGKTRLTPVAKFDKVRCDGVMLSKATLHNLQNVINKDIHIGDILTIERAGGVIPYVKSSRAGGDRRAAVISKCPSCKSSLVRKGVNLCCVNDECRGTIAARLTDEVKTAKIKGLGPATISKLVNGLDVRTIAGIRALTVEQVMTLKGFGRKSSEKLINNINR